MKTTKIIDSTGKSIIAISPSGDRFKIDSFVIERSKSPSPDSKFKFNIKFRPNENYQSSYYYPSFLRRFRRNNFSGESFSYVIVQGIDGKISFLEKSSNSDNYIGLIGCLKQDVRKHFKLDDPVEPKEKRKKKDSKNTYAELGVSISSFFEIERKKPDISKKEYTPRRRNLTSKMKSEFEHQLLDYVKEKIEWSKNQVKYYSVLMLDNRVVGSVQLIKPSDFQVYGKTHNSHNLNNIFYIRRNYPEIFPAGGPLNIERNIDFQVEDSMMEGVLSYFEEREMADNNETEASSAQ